MKGLSGFGALLALALSASCRDHRGSLPAEPAATSANPSSLRAGELAPELSALSQTGYRVSLSQFLDRPVAVYFCPGGFDASCTGLVTALRDGWLRLNQRLGMLLLVVGSDYQENRAFSALHELPFLILADTTGTLAERYGVAARGDAAQPVGVLVGVDGKVLRVFPQNSAVEHVAALDRELPD